VKPRVPLTQEEVVAALDANGAVDVRVVNLEGKSTLCEAMIFCTGLSGRHMRVSNHSSNTQCSWIISVCIVLIISLSDTNAASQRHHIQGPEKKEALKQYADKIKSKVGGDDIETIISILKTNVYHYEENVNKSLRLSWNARTTGDNPDDFSQRFYGDSDIRPKHDDESHGTHVAGIVAANRANSLGMKGVANKVAIMALRAVPNEGDEYDKDIAMSIRYAADNGADIVNMSFGKGFSPHSDKVREAIVYAESKGVLLVNAAGNDGENIDVVPTYPNDSVDNGPEVANNLITVGALGPSLSSRMVASFSNYGLNNVDIFAPGAIIYSTTPSNNYNSYSGTSMAAPAVSGVAALVKSYFPKLSPNAVKKVIMESGLPISMEVRVGASGMETQLNKVSRTGKIANAYNALLYASTHFKMLKKMK